MIPAANALLVRLKALLPEYWFKVSGAHQVKTEDGKQVHHWDGNKLNVIDFETRKQVNAAILDMFHPRHLGCLRCRISPTFAAFHTTPDSDHGGCSPLCQLCWDELHEPEFRLPYYRQLFDLWESQKGDSELPCTWEELQAAVEAEDPSGPLKLIPSIL